MPTHQLLAHVMAEASRSFFAPRSVDDTLARVTASVVGLISGADSADILMIVGKRTFSSHAPTSDLPVRLDELQEQLRGACLDAARHRPAVVVSGDLAADARWPRFGPAAAQAGINSTLSYTLYTGDDALGALNIFARELDAFTDDDVEIGLALATHAAIALYTASKNEKFEYALASRDLIGQAKGKLMERHGIDAVQAFELLSRWSQDSNVPITVLAEQIAAAGPQPRHR
ncbi:hypothetical protein A3K89_17365 [Rhodococcoides kyotonense]|uniref:ANTAR domain-containing protein n=2 Tax=Rhodococcoides kyotonense TaxID=398843 RepID=A0A177YLL7_9NOCA|nr:hypothetical protein A3K89_17365 [Rhodococcus kyotonensis]